MPPRQRADLLAFEQGLAESREQAKSLIMAGRILLAENSQPIAKPGQQLPPGCPLRLKPGRDFVSRGAHKLETILDRCAVDVAGKICLDAGASTGGFTDCLLRRGAARVYAIDVGKNQLHERLRANPAVVSMEGVNLRHAPPQLLPEHVEFMAADVSFISLTLILPACARWLAPGALAALLIKPQFELEPRKVCKGIVRQEIYRQEAVAKIEGFCRNVLAFDHLATIPAKIRGSRGNQEYMALFRAPGSDCQNNLPYIYGKNKIAFSI